MPDRIVLIGLGGIGSQLLVPLVGYLSFRPGPRPILVLVDGDGFEPANRSRQLFPDDALGTDKAEALAQVAGTRHDRERSLPGERPGGSVSRVWNSSERIWSRPSPAAGLTSGMRPL